MTFVVREKGEHFSGYELIGETDLHWMVNVEMGEAARKMDISPIDVMLL